MRLCCSATLGYWTPQFWGWSHSNPGVVCLWGASSGLRLYISDGSPITTREQRAPTVFFTLMFGAVFAAIPLLTPLTKSRWRGGFSITLTLLPLVNAAALFLALFAMYESER